MCRFLINEVPVHLNNTYLCCFIYNIFSKGIDLSFYAYEKETLDSAKSQQLPLVLMHGLMGSKQNWQSLAKVFGRTGRKVSSTLTQTIPKE